MGRIYVDLQTLRDLINNPEHILTMEVAQTQIVSVGLEKLLDEEDIKKMRKKDQNISVFYWLF